MNKRYRFNKSEPENMLLYIENSTLFYAQVTINRK